MFVVLDKFLEGKRGKVAELAEIDADDGDAHGGEDLGIGEDGAIAAEDDGESGLECGEFGGGGVGHDGDVGDLTPAIGAEQLEEVLGGGDGIGLVAVGYERDVHGSRIPASALKWYGGEGRGS